jgi:amino acid permease
MLGTAYEAHFNAPLFYRELKDNTVKRYNAMVGTSFAVTILTMTAVTAFGFLTFGGAAKGFILNNVSLFTLTLSHYPAL